MKTILCGLSICLVLFSASCDSKAVPVAFAKTCDKANDGTTVEITGYFKDIGMTMCSKHGNEPMRCPVNFGETPELKEGLVNVYIDLGSGENSVEELEDKRLEIRDMNGEKVETSQKVKLTADVTVLDTPRDDKMLQDCFVTAKKIEKAK